MDLLKLRKNIHPYCTLPKLFFFIIQPFLVKKYCKYKLFYEGWELFVLYLRQSSFGDIYTEYSCVIKFNTCTYLWYCLFHSSFMSSSKTLDPRKNFLISDLSVSSSTLSRFGFTRFGTLDASNSTSFCFMKYKVIKFLQTNVLYVNWFTASTTSHYLK